jgi:hypothetical protein
VFGTVHVKTAVVATSLRGEVRHQGMPPPPPYGPTSTTMVFYSFPPPKDESIALCEDCKTGVVYFKATVYGLVSVCGEAKGMFRRQGLKSPMVMVYRASWKHRGCFSKLFLTTMALGFSSFHLVQDLTFFLPFPSPWPFY